MKAKDLKELMEKGEVMLIDVRESSELEGRPTIEGAVNISMGKMFTEAGNGDLPKDKKIVVTCKSGGRCGIVARELTEKGFDIEMLEGGIKAWEAEFGEL